jgi:hypothetical protein
MTHVDADHVEGVVLLVNDRDLALDIGEVWFNGEPQLTRELGPVQGEILGAILAERGLPWNTGFNGAAIAAPDEGKLITRDVPGGLRVTVLAPTSGGLRRLRDGWVEACREAGLQMGSIEAALAVLRARPALSPAQVYLGDGDPPDVRRLARTSASADRSVPNASSIVLLLEYGTARILLAGDSTPSALGPAVRRLLTERGADSLPLTALKLPHHGSGKNLTTELLRYLPAEHYLFSTDGSYFGHPDDVAVAKVLEYGTPGAELVFNYSNPRTRKWDDDRLRERYGHRLRYPDSDATGVYLEWEVPDE